MYTDYSNIYTGRTRLPQPKFGREIQIQGSAVLKAVKYDASQCILDITLKSGQRYRYRNVSAYRFASIVGSRSVGKAYAGLKNDVKMGWTQSQKLPKR